MCLAVWLVINAYAWDQFSSALNVHYSYNWVCCSLTIHLSMFPVLGPWRSDSDYVKFAVRLLYIHGLCWISTFFFFTSLNRTQQLGLDRSCCYGGQALDMIKLLVGETKRFFQKKVTLYFLDSWLLSSFSDMPFLLSQLPFQMSLYF